MAMLELNDDELLLLIEGMGRLQDDKRVALATSQKGNMPFTARDFGLPQIDALIERIETAYNAS